MAWDDVVREETERWAELRGAAAEPSNALWDQYERLLREHRDAEKARDIERAERTWRELEPVITELDNRGILDEIMDAGLAETLKELELKRKYTFRYRRDNPREGA